MEKRVGVRPKGPPIRLRYACFPFRQDAPRCRRRAGLAGGAAPTRPRGARIPAGGGQFSQRPRLCGGLSRHMLLNHGFSAAAGSVCRLFTAAASANRLFAKTAFVRPLHRGCFYTPVFHSGRLRAPVLHRTWFCTPACLPFRRSRSVSGAGIKENGAARAGCTVSCIGVAEASLRRKRVTGESVLRRSTDSLFCCD